MGFVMEKVKMELAPTLDELLILMRMEYDEMPDLKLTLAQARRSGTGRSISATRRWVPSSPQGSSPGPARARS